MRNKWWRNEFKVGLMAIVGIILLSALLITSSNWRFTGRGREVTIYFGSVSGLLKNAPVYMYGVEVGRVAAVELKDHRVEVIARVRPEEPIREGYQIRIDIIGIVGEKYIEIINGPLDNLPANEDALQGISPISLGHILTSVNEITEKAIGTIDSVQSFVNTNEKTIHDVAVELKDFIVQARGILRKTMGNVDVLLAKVNKLTGAAGEDVEQTMTSLQTFAEGLNADRERISSLAEDIANDLDQLIAHTTPIVKESAGNFRKTSEDLQVIVEKVSQHIDGLNSSLSQLIEQFSNVTASSDQKLQDGLNEFGESAAALNEIVDRIDNVVADIESGRGTVGKLITDDESYGKLNEMMVAGKNAVEDVSDIADSVSSKLRFFDAINMRKEYQLSYDRPSRSLQNQFMLSLIHSDRYSYMAGLSVREDNTTYDLQVGRKFGDLMVRAGAIRSKVGIGLEYWPFSRRIGILLEGIDITDEHPELDMDFAVRFWGDWHFIFGAEDLAGDVDEIGLNFGIRGIFGK